MVLKISSTFQDGGQNYEILNYSQHFPFPLKFKMAAEIWRSLHFSEVLGVLPKFPLNRFISYGFQDKDISPLTAKFKVAAKIQKTSYIFQRS